MNKKTFMYLIPLVLVFAIGVLFANSFVSSGSNSGNSATDTALSGEKLRFAQAIGEEAPDFSLEGIDGGTIRLGDYRGKNVVLFFNEGDMCYPACWEQIAALGNDKRFNTGDVVAFSIVVDTKNEWKRIVSQMPKLSDAKILFDAKKSVSSAYDVLSLPSSMHRGSYPGHTYFVIDKNGIIRYVLDDPSMGIRNDRLASEIEKLE